MANKSGTGSPTLNLPKGGGAISGIGEKFQPNLQTGTGNFSIPIATSPSRSGFGPQLTLQYSSGNGNSSHGMGWDFPIPRITCKTEKGLPKYTDEDVFVLSGAEDLVPVLDEAYAPVVKTRPPYVIHLYRPRIEGLFARIEKWVKDDSGVHWRIITKENVTSIYGKTADARMFDPQNPHHIFEWLLQETFDDKGNHILYEYARDNHSQQNPFRNDIFEVNRTYCQLYLRRIYYGNLPKRLVDENNNPVLYDDDKEIGVERKGTDLDDRLATTKRRYAFEVVFDYFDENNFETYHEPPPIGRQETFVVDSQNNMIPIRPDPFSSFRAGFEIRTLRRCRRVLMFHHFKELGGPTLVRSTNFEYSNNPDTLISFLTAVTVKGYRKEPDGTYTSKKMPPITFKYTEFNPHKQRYQSISAKGNDLPPRALDDPNFTLIDISGNGLPDILNTTHTGYYLWENLGDGKIERRHPQHQTPSGLQLSDPNVVFGDIGGDGLADLIVTSPSMSGFFESTRDGNWKPFKKFEKIPTVLTLSDPNLRLVDLTGDGLSDILVTSDHHFLWYPSLSEKGYDKPHMIERKHNLDEFPDVYFDDPSGRIRLAGMTGNGLNDIVMIHNGRIDYWPNLGYGKFGKRITMAHAPILEHDFDPKRLFLTELDGSGCASIVYVDFNSVHFWFNQSGNSWSKKHTVNGTPFVTDLTSVQFADFFGTGTSSLVWSYDYGAHLSGSNYKVLDFNGGIKPYLLYEMDNNMGATTRVQYAPSTKFYLEDKKNHEPWVSNLPFPVLVVEKTETIDHISKTKLVTTYKYHNGYYDGDEREFRGFGRVDQFDTEEFERFVNSSLHEGDGLFDNNIASYHAPPILTKTWFHTGSYLEGDYISLFFAHEYYGAPKKYEQDYEQKFQVFVKTLLPDTVRPKSLLASGGCIPWNLSDEEKRQASRSLKGSILRQEIYALDSSPKSMHPYSVSERNYDVEMLQPLTGNKHAVFFTHPREQIDYHYERNLNDPRIGHTVILKVDAYGNVLRSASIGYGRRQSDADLSLLDQKKQTKTLITCTENNFTNSIDQDDIHRTPVEHESRTYELTGLISNAGKRFDFARIDEAVITAAALNYEEKPPSGLQKRLIEHTKIRYRKNDLTGPLQFGIVESLALPFESYKLAFTPGLLNKIYGNKVTVTMLSEGGYVHLGNQNWWVPSGRTFYWENTNNNPAAELAFAKEHFFLAHRLEDPFHNNTFVAYDKYSLLLQKTHDALDNTVAVMTQDYRVLQPSMIMDPNRNRSAVKFDVLGFVVATAVMGKQGEHKGDSLDDLTLDDLNMDDTTIISHIQNPFVNPHGILKKATTRLIYDLYSYQRSSGTASPLPNVVYTLARETHDTDLDVGRPTTIQHSLSYSDGFGREIQTKIQAEPLKEQGVPPTPRWVGSGWTIFNNKGKPIKKYEPFFSNTHIFEFAKIIGVSSTFFYDPIERVVATLHPNHTHEKVVFDQWKQEIWDVNDTVLMTDPKNDPHVGVFFQRLPSADYLPTWYESRIGGQKGSKEQEAAQKAAEHRETPVTVYFDSLGRAFLTVANNGTEGKYPTRAELDIENNQRAVIDDPRNTMMSYGMGRIVMLYDYDMLGNRIKQQSMEAGKRWTLNDVTGKIIYRWDERTHKIHAVYDELGRPKKILLSEGVSAEKLVEQIIYGETQGSALNHRGRVYKHYDGGGIIENEEYDFKGNLIKSNRRLAIDYKNVLDWSVTPQPPIESEAQSFRASTTFDALNRIVTQTSPDGTITRFVYNEANLLEHVEANLIENDNGRMRVASIPTAFVDDIGYNAKGQREYIEYHNGVKTVYEYDDLTFRLIHLKTVQKNQDSSTKILQDLRYTYDPVGNIAHIQDDAQDAIFSHGSVVEPSNDYTYDPIYRLIEATGREHLGQTVTGARKPPAPTSHSDEPRVNLNLPHPNDPNAMGTYSETYQYDRVGNFREVIHSGVDPSHPGWSRGYDYNESGLIVLGDYNEFGLVNQNYENNRLSSTVVGTKTEPYEYDEHGNMIKMSHLHMMKWDYRDQLQATSKQIVNNGGTPETTFYVYNSSGERIRKVTDWYAAMGDEPKRKEERIYLGNYEIYRKYENDGNIRKLERSSLHMMDDKQRIALVETKTLDISDNTDLNISLIRYLIGNHLGSAILELDMEGIVISYEEYYPYGSTSYQAARSQTETPKRYRYTGKERDEESGLYYHGARYYAPWLGRWTSCDPINITGGLNLYAYGSASPTNFIDPSGTAPKKYEDQRGRDTAAKAREMEQNLTDANKKGYKPDPMQKRAEKLAKKRGKTPIEQHHHKGVKQAASVKLDPKKMGDPMSSVWSTKKDPTVQAGIGDKPVWDPDFEGKKKTPHNVAKELDLNEQAKGPKTAKGLEDAASASKQRLPATADLSERAKMDWTPSTPNGPSVDPSTGRVITKEAKLVHAGGEVVEKAGKGAKVLKALGKAGRHLAAAVPLLGIVAGQASAATAVHQGDYTGAAMDEIGFIPVVGDLLDAARGGLALGEALNEGLGIEDVAGKHGMAVEGAAKSLGFSQDTSRLIGATGAALSSITVAPSIALQQTVFGWFK
ncbi:MAG: VCBS repeat-containing protein [Thaumarchaeota archaeon]|nr:VCBS repeat-containing protein [Nitrososphaerota archaeon]